MLNLEQSEKFFNDIVAVIKNRFPKSLVYWKKNSILGTPFYTVHFYLANSAEECANHIMLNDALNCAFHVDCCNSEGCISDEIVITSDKIGIIRDANKADPVERFCVYGRVKVPFRKIKGNTENCIEKMRKLVDKIATAMIENADAINNGCIKGIFTVADKIA